MWAAVSSLHHIAKNMLLAILYFQYFNRFHINLRAKPESFVLNTVPPTPESSIYKGQTNHDGGFHNEMK